MTDKINKSNEENKVDFTAIVVTLNEDRHLRDCLLSLNFCNQLIVADLGSTDSSVEIAKKFNAEIFYPEKQPIVEQIHAKLIGKSKNDWVILSDPDEVMPDGIEQDLRYLISIGPTIGCIYIPLQHYFKGKQLSNSVWGNHNLAKPLVLHKLRNDFLGKVHCGTRILNNFSSVVILRKKNNYIKHYWMDSYKQLFGKHLRYIKQEGESRYSQGERFSPKELIIRTIYAFIHSYVTCCGFNSLTGTFLSFFYSWYTAMSLLSLRKFQKTLYRLQ